MCTHAGWGCACVNYDVTTELKNWVLKSGGNRKCFSKYPKSFTPLKAVCLKRMWFSTAQRGADVKGRVTRVVSMSFSCEHAADVTPSASANGTRPLSVTPSLLFLSSCPSSDTRDVVCGGVVDWFRVNSQRCPVSQV